MRKQAHEDIALEEDDVIYRKGDTLNSFHHQAHQPIFQKVILAEFQSVWLKRYVVSSPSSDVVLPHCLVASHIFGI